MIAMIEPLAERLGNPVARGWLDTARGLLGHQCGDWRLGREAC